MPLAAKPAAPKPAAPKPALQKSAAPKPAQPQPAKATTNGARPAPQPAAKEFSKFAPARPPPQPVSEGFSKSAPARPGLQPTAKQFSKSASPANVASPPASPPAEEVAPEEEEAGPGENWKKFADVDPLYALLGEMGTHKVFNTEKDAIDEDRLRNYTERLFAPGVCKKMKDWVEVWASMDIPIPNQHQVLEVFLQVGLESEASETMPEVLTALVLGHRTKIKAVEEALSTMFEAGEDHGGCLSRFFFLIFPKSPTSEWGWSRVGWSWQQWWNMFERVLNALDKSSAFECLRSLLEKIEQESGTYLPHQQIWDEKRIGLIKVALCRFGGYAEDELSCALSVVLE